MVTSRPHSRLHGEAERGFPYRAMVLVLLAGLAGRVGLSALAPRWGYKWDHFDNIGMGLTASQYGLLKVYSPPPEKNAEVSGRIYRNGKFVPFRRTAPKGTNYPPLGMLLFWLQTSLLGLLDPSLTANTFTARMVMSFASVAAELVMALGVMLLGAELFGKKAGLLAASICWLFPPLAMNSSFWGQTDSWFLAPAVFFIWLVIRRRWVAAGLVLALAAMLKPQGILLAPVALFAAVTLRQSQTTDLTGSTILLRLGKIFGVATAAIAVIAAPWMLADGLAWVKRAYVENFSAYGYTTLKAFNIWYVDALRCDSSPSFSVLDPTVTIVGISKDTWGRVLTLVVMATLAILCWRRRRGTVLAVVVFAGLWLWSSFIWPTRVHERYIVYCMPVMITLAVGLRRLWPAVIGAAIVGIAAMSWNLWLKHPAGSLSARATAAYYSKLTQQHRQRTATIPPALRPPPPTPEQAVRMFHQRYYRPARRSSEILEWLVTLTSLGAYAWAVVATLLWPQHRPVPRRPTRGTARRRHR